MSVVTFEADNFDTEQHESVLDCLLRNGKAIPYACKAGMCQACLVKAVEGEPPETARKWIRKSLQDKGYALACQWVPEDDVTVGLPALEEFSVAARITELLPLNAQVLKVCLAPVEVGTMFACHPGQYLTITSPTGITRSYSVANDVDRDGHIELHIGSTPYGSFTGWLFNEACPGDTLHVRGPAGDCFYDNCHLEEGDDFPLILAATGTGLAPLYGIVNEALARGHQGPITVYHGVLRRNGLYYTQTLQALADKHQSLTYHPCVLEEDTVRGLDENASDLPGLLKGDIREIIPDRLDSHVLPRSRVFLCGNPDFVHGLRKRIFLKGARSANIFCDPFLERQIVAKGAEVK